MNQDFLKKITPWIPLLIAAGYFIFLVSTWQLFVTNLKAADERFDKMLNKMQGVVESPEVKDE